MEAELTLSPMSLLQQAIAKGVDIDQLSKLMDLRDRWANDQAKKAFLEALSRFQSLVPTLSKNKIARVNSQKGSYSYKYADLGSISAQLRQPLTECGLSFRWEFEETNERMRVTCIISHKDGHTERTTMEGEKDDSGGKNKIQQKGSTHTYLQRYTLIGALGLSTAEEDDDGRGHSKREQKQELTEEEILAQWQQKVNEASHLIALTALFNRNKRVIEANPSILDLFKKRKGQLTTEVPKPVLTEMP